MPGKKRKFVFAANNRNGYLCGKELLAKDCIPEILLLHPAPRQNWGKEIKTLFSGTPVIEWGNNTATNLKESGAEVLLSVNFGYIFTAEILALFEYPVNVHMGYLPYNRGSHPNVWSIIENTPAGVTMHLMTEDVDKGDIISQVEVEVCPDDTGKSLYEKLERASAELTADRFPSILRGDFNTSPLPAGGTFHYAHEFRDLCRICQDKPVAPMELITRLRALSFPPYKNAYIEVDDKKFFIDVSLVSD